MTFTACLLSLAVWGFFGAPPHRWVFHAIKVRKYCNKTGRQDCETADGGKGHLAGMAFEITLIFLIDYISKRWYLYDSPGFSPKLICLVGISLKRTLTWECSYRSSYTPHELYFQTSFCFGFKCIFSMGSGLYSICTAFCNLEDHRILMVT